MQICFALSFSSFLLTLGPALPKATTTTSLLEIQGDVYAFGGWDGKTRQSAVHKLRWFTCPLLFGCWLFGSRDLSQAEKEITTYKTEQIHKTVIIFTQNENLGPF